MRAEAMHLDVAGALTVAPQSLAEWLSAFDVRSLPVLERSACAIEELRAHEDDVDAHRLADRLGADPLLTVKVLSLVADLPGRRGRTDHTGEPRTLLAALVMLGIGPFFRAFGRQTAVEALLVSNPEALGGFRQVLHRANRAADFALAFAVHRMDPDAGLIHSATLLHEFAELLLWCRAPALAVEIERRRTRDPTIASCELQREVLNIGLVDLRRALMSAWRLPTMLTQISDDRHADATQVRNVRLAVRLARHSARGWEDPAIPDDVSEIAALLQLGVAPTWHLLRQVDG